MTTSVPQELLAKLEKKRLVFAVTTGRSGTGYLAKMLRFVPNAVSHHEPEPQFADVMRLVQQNPTVGHEFWLTKKLPQIAEEPAAIYIETSHLFCKGFVEPLLELGFSPDLIILHRPHRQVATSLYRLNVIPGRTEKGLKYLLSPGDPGVLPLPDWEALHDYQLCFWYCLEIERRCRKYNRLFLESDARVVELSLHEITTLSGFKKLIKALDLPKLGFPTWVKYLLNKNKRTNIKRYNQSLSEVSPDMESLEIEVLNLTKM